MIKIEFYGVLEQVAGARELELTPATEPTTLEALLVQLTERLPELERHLPRLACAVGDEIVPRDRSVGAGATVALLPPVSGG